MSNFPSFLVAAGDGLSPMTMLGMGVMTVVIIICLWLDSRPKGYVIKGRSETTIEPKR